MRHILLAAALAVLSGCSADSRPTVRTAACANPDCGCEPGKCLCKPCGCGKKINKDPLIVPSRAMADGVVPRGRRPVEQGPLGGGRPKDPYEGVVYEGRWTGRAKAGGSTSPDGKEPVQLEYPQDRWTRNTVGTDGSGLCVFTSMKHAGDWQGDPLFAQMAKYMQRHPGGGYPEKVRNYLTRAAKELGLPEPRYIQVESNDMEILKAASRNRYMPCVTYGLSPTGRYRGQFINHMVNTVHNTDGWVAVLDNNYVDALEWMPEDDFKIAYRASTSTGTNGQGWSIILLTEAPPPAPRNKAAK